MAMIVDVIVEICPVMDVGSIQQSCGLDWTDLSKQVVQKEESFLVVVLIEDKPRWK